MANTLTQSPIVKYVKDVRALPKEMFHWRFFATAFAFALTGAAKGWDEGSASSISKLQSFQREYGLDTGNGSDNAKISNIVSLVNVGAGIGAFLSFFLNDKIGRVQSMRIYIATYAVGSLISCFSYGNIGALYTGRIVAGLGIGACTVIGPMTLAEIAPKMIRGLITLWFNVSMLTTQGIGVFVVLGAYLNISPTLHLQYQVPWFVQTFVPAICILLSLFAIESPRWLLLCNRRQDALKAIVELRGLPEDHPYVQEEWSQLSSHIEDENAQHKGKGYFSIIKETFVVRANLRRVQLIIVAYILAQFSGANSITNYLPTIIGLIGVTNTETAIYVTGLYTFTKAIFCLLASLLFIDLVGRRKSLMIGIAIQIICQSYLAGYLKYFLESPDLVSKGASEGAIAFIFIHALGWAVGLYTLPYLFGAELWPNSIRSFGGAMSQGFHWIFYFGITKATPSLLYSFDTWGAFVFFAAWCIIAFGFTFFCVPETRGLGLDEIDRCFERPIYKMRGTLAAIREIDSDSYVEKGDTTFTE
ncbi:general substrate transporter [Xylaria cf. heliscus]|nr:general substrate transporter [Xylaria cf. heliscus]